MLLSSKAHWNPFPPWGTSRLPPTPFSGDSMVSDWNPWPCFLAVCLATESPMDQDGMAPLAWCDYYRCGVHTATMNKAVRRLGCMARRCWRLSMSHLHAWHDKADWLSQTCSLCSAVTTGCGPWSSFHGQSCSPPTCIWSVPIKNRRLSSNASADGAELNVGVIDRALPQVGW